MSSQESMFQPEEQEPSSYQPREVHESQQVNRDPREQPPAAALVIVVSTSWTGNFPISDSSFSYAS